MKILIVCQYYYPENFVISNIASSLAKKGNDVSVLTGKPNYGYGYILEEYKNISFEEIEGVKVYRVNLYPRNKTRFSIIKNYLSFWKNSKKWIKKNLDKDFDIVFSMSLSPVTILAAGNLYKKKKHVPHVVYCVDLWPESTLITHAVRKKSLFYKILYFWSKKLYSKVDEVIISSPSFKQYLEEVLGVLCPIDYIPQPSLIETHEIEKQIFNKDDFNIVYCGNIGQIQLINLIPETMKLLLDYPKIKMHIIGMGPKLDELLKKTEKYHLEEKIIYYGPMPVKKANKYLLDSDALYLSLDDNGYVGKTIPNKLSLYLTYKKPIIGVIDGDGKTILTNAGSNLICSADPIDIKNKILNLYHNKKEENEKIGLDNYRYYFSNFSLETCSNKLISIFLKTINKHI